jgi:hypothetical protein
MNKLILSIVLTLLISCASAPSQDEIDNADYGKYVSESQCTMLAKNFIKNRLKDPSSAQFNNVYCYKGWLGSAPIVGVPVTYGYAFGGNVNGKNSYGGYTGFTPFAGVVKDDGSGAKVIRYCITETNTDVPACIPAMVY